MRTLTALKTVLAALTVLGSATLSAAPASAGSGNPGYWDDYVSSYSSETYFEVFEGGEPINVELEGDGCSDIDLWVYDSQGQLVAKSSSNGDFEVVSFVPAYTDEFRIVVENNGKPNGAGFILTTN